MTPKGLHRSFTGRASKNATSAELMAAPGVDIVGPLPDGIGLTTEFIFGIHAATKNEAGGRALGEFLRSDAVRAVMKARGLTPA